MIAVSKLSGGQKDFMISHLRAQANNLGNMLYNLENSEGLEEEYVEESLKELEKKFRFMRKIIR